MKYNYIARPSLMNRRGEKIFDNAKDACEYLNEVLAPEEGDEEYIFSTLNTSSKKLSDTMSQYMNMGKLEIRKSS
jgi:hypothetical protein